MNDKTVDNDNSERRSRINNNIRKYFQNLTLVQVGHEADRASKFHSAIQDDITREYLSKG